MKRTNIYTLANLALLLGLVACTQEDSMTDPGTTLFDGPYPLQIGTVTVSSEVSEVQTRVAETTDGTGSVFEENDVITVQLGDETVTYTFNGTDWTTDTQLYWTSAGQTLTAWYTSPDYTNEGTIDLSDQSNGLVYVLRAEASFATTVNLSFTHRLAKVRVVTQGTDDSSESVLKLTAHTICTVNQGEISTTGSEGTITMYKTGYDDIVICWEATVPDNTTISSITIDGRTCTLDNGGIITEAGSLHALSLTVDAAEYQGFIYNSTTNTYTVYTTNGLLAWNKAASSNLTLNCTLAEDINLTDIEYTWLRVGDSDYPYTGTFEGGDHTITKLSVNQSTDYAGLIGCLGEGGKAQNLTLKEMDLTGSTYLGGVVGYNNGGTVTNCTTSGSVSGGNYAGGVVGINYGTVTACSFSGSVSASGSYAGGVVGRTYGTVTDCNASGDVYAYRYAGGVVGRNQDTVTACYSSGSVSGAYEIGGVVGRTHGTVIACYASGSVSGTWHVGGVVGLNDSSYVTACYHASGNINLGASYVGGVVGYNNSGTVRACYYSDFSGNGIGYSNGGSGSATEVDGSSTTWDIAVNTMNSAISTSGWQYEILPDNTLPTLTKTNQ